MTSGSPPLRVWISGNNQFSRAAIETSGPLWKEVLKQCSMLGPSQNAIASLLDPSKGTVSEEREGSERSRTTNNTGLRKADHFRQEDLAGDRSIDPASTLDIALLSLAPAPMTVQLPVRTPGSVPTSRNEEGMNAGRGSNVASPNPLRLWTDHDQTNTESVPDPRQLPREAHAPDPNPLKSQSRDISSLRTTDTSAAADFNEVPASGSLGNSAETKAAPSGRMNKDCDRSQHMVDASMVKISSSSTAQLTPPSAANSKREISTEGLRSTCTEISPNVDRQNSLAPALMTLVAHLKHGEADTPVHAAPQPTGSLHNLVLPSLNIFGENNPPQHLSCSITNGGRPGEGATAAPAFRAFSDLESAGHTNSAPLVHLNAKEAEGGYKDPELGWVAVRAHASLNGIHASVMSGSVDTESSLSIRAAGLPSFLAQREIHLTSLTVAGPDIFSPTSGFSHEEKHPPQQRDGYSSHPNKSADPEVTTLSNSSYRVSADIETPALDRWPQRWTGSGAYVSVMA
jgi:hypothetical protein